jgi:hypothetical protein
MFFDGLSFLEDLLINDLKIPSIYYKIKRTCLILDYQTVCRILKKAIIG